MQSEAKTLITANRTDTGVLEEGLFQNHHLITGRKTLPSGLWCEGTFDPDGSLTQGCVYQRPLFEQGRFDRGYLVEGLHMEWSLDQLRTLELGTRSHGSLVHGIQTDSTHVAIGDFHQPRGCLRRGTYVDESHVRVGYFSPNGEMHHGGWITLNNDDGDVFEVGQHSQGRLDSGTRVQQLDYVHMGQFNESGDLTQGLRHYVGNYEIGEFTRNQLIHGTHLNRQGHIERGQFSESQLVEGHRLYGYEDRLNIYERGTFDAGSLTGFGLRVHDNFVEQGNFNQGKMQEGTKISAFHLEYMTLSQGRHQICRVDKQTRSLYVGEYSGETLSGYRMNFDDLENPTIERLQGGRVIKKYQLVEIPS
jgi:hypothetical protein